MDHEQLPTVQECAEAMQIVPALPLKATATLEDLQDAQCILRYHVTLSVRGWYQQPICRAKRGRSSNNTRGDDLVSRARAGIRHSQKGLSSPGKELWVTYNAGLPMLDMLTAHASKSINTLTAIMAEKDEIQMKPFRLLEGFYDTATESKDMLRSVEGDLLATSNESLQTSRTVTQHLYQQQIEMQAAYESMKNELDSILPSPLHADENVSMLSPVDDVHPNRFSSPEVDQATDNVVSEEGRKAQSTRSAGGSITDESYAENLQDASLATLNAYVGVLHSQRRATGIRTKWVEPTNPMDSGVLLPVLILCGWESFDDQRYALNPHWFQ
ncbi:hypothetical protein OPT61_g7014 [Boeremia exigua]|uniref:Uncharacterized protein n=1 Tax=Boeremia exigua TaxID=749465 RepID=A0ACC2I3U0_9PLEO|nr:hypothetical protein OPT61_g7014 [Boeremia exigua]